MRLIFFLVFSIIVTQDHSIDYYITNLLNGEPEEAILNIKKLENRYGATAEVLYLQALLVKDGKESMNKYKEIYNKFPNNKYSDNAVAKVAQYYYAVGLYIQSAEWYEKIPRYYPRSETLEHSLRYLFNCWMITGEREKAEHSLKVFKRQFPNLDLNAIISLEALDLVQNDSVKDVIVNNNETEKINPATNKTDFGDWSVQAGAYLDISNAKRQKNLIENLGYFVKIERKTFKSGKVVFYVLVGNFTESRARTVSSSLKTDYGIDSFIKKIN